MAKKWKTPAILANIHQQLSMGTLLGYFIVTPLYGAKLKAADWLSTYISCSPVTTGTIVLTPGWL